MDLPLHDGALGSFDDVERNRQHRVLGRFSSLLKPALRPEEQVLFATEGHRRISLVDFFTRGLILATQHKACVLVFTTERLFVFPTGSDYLPNRALSAIDYGSVAEMTISGVLGRKLTVRYHDGSIEKFAFRYHEVAAAAAATIPELLSRAPRRERDQRRFLCPKCYAAIPAGSFECPGCHTEFKSREEAIRRALWLPGGGYFYMNQHLAGVMDAIVELALLWYVFVLILDAVRHGLALGDLGAILGMSFLLAIEKWVSVHHVLAMVENYVPAE